MISWTAILIFSTLCAHIYCNLYTYQSNIPSIAVMQSQSISRLAPIGVSAALEADSVQPRPKIFDEFALTDRVGMVSGGNRGLGLEMALALCEAGARVIYCIDLPEKASEEWTKTKTFVDKLNNGSRLEYISADVTDQEKMWKIGEEIGEKEKRMDVCVAAAGILKSHTNCLEYPAQQFQDVSELLLGFRVVLTSNNRFLMST